MGPDPRPGTPFKFLDSALAIAVVVGILHYAGWTFRQAYLRRFSIDPSGLDASSVSIAVDGVAAIGTTLLAWLAACAFLLIAGACTWAFVSFTEWRRGRNGPPADRTTLITAQAAGIAFGMLFLLWGGSIAGRMAAEQRVANVRNGEVWYYHVQADVIAAVPIAQGSTTTWLLTDAGIRPIATTDIRLIDGPLFDRISGRPKGKVPTHASKTRAAVETR